MPPRRTPRAALDLDFFGINWYHRDWHYFRDRAFLSSILLLGMLTSLFMSSVIIYAILSSTDGIMQLSLLSVAVLAIIVGFIPPVRRFRLETRGRTEGMSLRTQKRHFAAYKARQESGARFGITLGIGGNSSLLAPLAFAVAPLFVGMMTVYFVMSFRYYASDEEYDAWQLLKNPDYGKQPLTDISLLDLPPPPVPYKRRPKRKRR